MLSGFPALIIEGQQHAIDKVQLYYQIAQAFLRVDNIPKEFVISDTTDMPVRDALSVSVYLNDTDYNRAVSGAVGSAIWAYDDILYEDASNPRNYTLVIRNDAVLEQMDRSLSEDQQ